MLENTSGTCPHCGGHAVFTSLGNATAFTFPEFVPGTEEMRWRGVSGSRCPGCENVVLFTYEKADRGEKRNLKRLFPIRGTRPQPSADVPLHIRTAYEEAAAVEPISRVAAAIMARRTLELTLQDSKVQKGGSLKQTIENAAKDGRASPTLVEQLHRLRDSGNYGAHPDLIGDFAAYEVDDTELDAAFDALNDLFEDFYTKPRLLEERRKRFATKDAEAKAKKDAAKNTGG